MQVFQLYAFSILAVSVPDPYYYQMYSMHIKLSMSITKSDVVIYSSTNPVCHLRFQAFSHSCHESCITNFIWITIYCLFIFQSFYSCLHPIQSLNTCYDEKRQNLCDIDCHLFYTIQHATLF